MNRDQYEAEHGADVDIDYERDRTFCAYCDEEIEPGSVYYTGELIYSLPVCVHKECFREYINQEMTVEMLADALNFRERTKEC